MTDAEQYFQLMLERGYRRKGLKWVNGECVPMTPQEFNDYLKHGENHERRFQDAGIPAGS